MPKTKGVQVHFVARENGPERLVTEAEIHFDYLRAIDSDPETVKRVKAWILDEYRKAGDEAA
jgi:hypothetical protein